MGVEGFSLVSVDEARRCERPKARVADGLSTGEDCERFDANIKQDTLENRDFCRVLCTAKQSHLVLQSKSAKGIEPSLVAEEFILAQVPIYSTSKNSLIYGSSNLNNSSSVP
jgi:hypothetical protein